LLLVLQGTPAAIDEELDTPACGMRCSLAQSAKESWIEVGDTRNPVIEDRRALGDGTASLGERTTVLTPSLARRTRVLTAKDDDA
jgi:hypothetical protein